MKKQEKVGREVGAQQRILFSKLWVALAVDLCLLFFIFFAFVVVAVQRLQEKDVVLLLCCFHV